MNKKIGVAINIILAAILVYFANRYADMQAIKSIPVDKIRYLEQAGDNFFNFGFVVCGISWVLANLMVVKTKRFIWLWLPFVFTTVVAFTIGYHMEDIFLFTKQNGLWKGGFSLSYFFSVFLILVVSIALVINYFVLKRFVIKA